MGVGGVDHNQEDDVCLSVVVVMSDDDWLVVIVAQPRTPTTVLLTLVDDSIAWNVDVEIFERHGISEVPIPVIAWEWRNKIPPICCE